MAHSSQQSAPPSDLFTVDSAPTSPGTPLLPGFWWRLLQYHSGWVLGTVWVATVIVAIVAMAGLFSPNHQSVETPSAPAETAVEPPSAPSAPTAWWAIAAVVGTCGLGSLVLTQIFNTTPAAERVKRQQERELRVKQSKARRRRLRAERQKQTKRQRLRTASGLKRLPPYQATDYPLLTDAPLPLAGSLPGTEAGQHVTDDDYLIAGDDARDLFPNLLPDLPIDVEVVADQDWQRAAAGDESALTVPAPPARPARRVPPADRPAKSARSSRRSRAQARSARSAPPSRRPAPSRRVPLPPAASSSAITAATAATSIPDVTVMPGDEAHPLDWQEASLAHSLDLRSQLPLDEVILPSQQAS